VCVVAATDPLVLVVEGSDVFLHVDGKILQSVKLLFTRRGFLTREYVEGRRIRYVSPPRLYLIFSVAYFAVSALTAKPPIVSDRDRAASRFRTQSAEEFGRVRVTGDFSRCGLTREEVAERIQHAQHDWVPRAMFLLVPIAALLVMASTRRTRRTYIEHLYFALHVHAVCFGLLALTALIGSAAPVTPTMRIVLSAMALLVIGWYVRSSFQRVYGGSWWRTAARSAFVFVAYLLIVTLTVIAVLVGAIVT
jgi:hypothetical protein